MLVLERQDKDSYVLALASPDQHFLDGAPLELCLPLHGAEIATIGDREVPGGCTCNVWWLGEASIV